MSGVRTLEDALDRVLYTGRRFNVSPIPSSGQPLDGFIVIRCGCGRTGQIPIDQRPYNGVTCPEGRAQEINHHMPKDQGDEQ